MWGYRFSFMSCFTAKKLDYGSVLCNNKVMENKKDQLTSSYMNTTESIRNRIESGGECFWRFVDFKDLPTTAVAKALSRLSRLGVLQRIGKGLYYRPKKTVFGQSKPNTSHLRNLFSHNKPLFPCGTSAANLLGFSTQQAAKVEVATCASSLPRLLIGKETIIHTRRPESWANLAPEEAAILDFLRKKGEHSELSPKETAKKLINHFIEENNFGKIFQTALTEPPRVRAMLGAIGQEIGFSEKYLSSLKKSLNPLSRFDFGSLGTLKHAREWQAKGAHP